MKKIVLKVIMIKKIKKIFKKLFLSNKKNIFLSQENY